MKAVRHRVKAKKGLVMFIPSCSCTNVDFRPLFNAGKSNGKSKTGTELDKSLNPILEKAQPVEFKPSIVNFHPKHGTPNFNNFDGTISLDFSTQVLWKEPDLSIENEFLEKLRKETSPCTFYIFKIRGGSELPILLRIENAVGIVIWENEEYSMHAKDFLKSKLKEIKEN